MANLIGMILRWIFKHFVMAIAIAITLVVGYTIKEQYDDYKKRVEAVTLTQDGLKNLSAVIFSTRKLANERAEQIKNSGLSGINQRINEIDQIINKKSKELTSIPDISLCVVMGGNVCERYVKGWDLKTEIKILSGERSYLVIIKASLDASEQLEKLRFIHIGIYNQLQQAKQQIAEAKAQISPIDKINPWSVAAINLEKLEKMHNELSLKNLQADANYKNHSMIAVKTKDVASKTVKIMDQADAETVRLKNEIEKLNDDHLNNWFTKAIASIESKLNNVTPIVLKIILGVIFIPVAIKGFYYYLIAPIAARQKPIIISTDVFGQIDGLNMNESGKFDNIHISRSSYSIAINEFQELLIHPEWLRGNAAHIKSDTKWLLNNTYPLSSLSAGLVGLTRIQTESTTTVTLGAMKDPLLEIGVIAVPEGSAFVFQPRRLIGVVQPKDRPVKITKHWRLGSPHAWLTLQLRYLVFHGPVELIVTGCRGVKIDSAGNGHHINQAQTIGFSANLAYSTSRCEPFNAYRQGAQELFNDSFDGGPGFFVYEELPHDGKKGGIFGRGIEGVTDSILKVFGV